jgi:hypothetical protein
MVGWHLKSLSIHQVSKFLPVCTNWIFSVNKKLCFLYILFWDWIEITPATWKYDKKV